MRRNDADQGNAELVAIQAVLIATLRRLAQDRPDLAPTLCQAFDEAEAILTGVALKMGLDDVDGTSVDALAIVDEMRRGVISDERWCRTRDGDFG